MSVESFKRELDVLIRARYPIIQCETFEESRLSTIMSAISAERSIELIVWSQTKGFTKVSGEPIEKITAPDRALKYIEESKNPNCYLLRDFHPYLKDPTIVRLLRDLSSSLKTTRKNIVFSSPHFNIPVELSKEMAVVSLPLPNREEIALILDETPAKTEMTEETREATIEASLGLTGEEIENVFAKSLVKSGDIDVNEVLTEKRQIVQKAGILEFVPVKQAFESIGGLTNLKKWLQRRKRGFTQEARAINLPTPKGMLLVGVPGCGKSLTAVCTGAAWQMPLLRLDMGKVFSGLVGSSEANMRLAMQTASSVAPCILWIDEIEKGLAGSGGSGGDGGTSTRVFGSFLTWMQEKSEPVFVLATANDISGLPPELLRKGRFDEIFFVDTPSAKERIDILKIHLKKREWDIPQLQEEAIIESTDQFTGAEIEQALIDAAYEAFFHDEELTMDHLLTAFRTTVPLAKTMKERIEQTRNWAQSRAVPASAPLASDNPTSQRLLEV